MQIWIVRIGGSAAGLFIFAFLLLYGLALHPTSRAFVSDKLGVSGTVQIDIDAVLNDLSASALAAREGNARQEARSSAQLAIENLEIAIQADPQAVVDALVDFAEQTQDAALKDMFAGIVNLMTQQDVQIDGSAQFEAEAIRLWESGAGLS